MKIDLKQLFPDAQNHDERTTNALLAALKSAFTNQFDYLNFKQAVQSMAEMNLEEATQYKSAFATAATIGVTKNNIIKSAERYLIALEKEKASFADALRKQIAEKIDGKKAELDKIKARILENERKIEELKKENILLQEAIDNADDRVEASKQKIKVAKENFLGAYDAIYSVIKNDIDSIQKFL